MHRLTVALSLGLLTSACLALGLGSARALVLPFGFPHDPCSETAIVTTLSLPEDGAGWATGCDTLFGDMRVMTALAPNNDDPAAPAWQLRLATKQGGLIHLTTEIISEDAGAKGPAHWGKTAKTLADYEGIDLRVVEVPGAAARGVRIALDGHTGEDYRTAIETAVVYRLEDGNLTRVWVGEGSRNRSDMDVCQWDRIADITFADATTLTVATHEEAQVTLQDVGDKLVKELTTHCKAGKPTSKTIKL